MPQYNSAQTFDGFVSLAQVCSPPAILQDCGFAGQEYFDFDQASPMSPGFLRSDLDFCQKRMTWAAEQQACYSSPRSVRSATIPMIGEYSGSSASNSPSPTETVQEQQHHKRRAQNRAAQRAYRDRKVRHLGDLERGITDIEKTMMRLQNENTELIRQLCDIRANNNNLRGAKQSADAGTSRDKSRRDSASRPMGSQCHSGYGITSAESRESESLYEPFAAMWNLIRLDPAVVEGKVSARVVLENLSRLADTGIPNLDRRYLPSPLLTDDDSLSSR